MAVKIKKKRCIGCEKCTHVCPGNLLCMKNGKAKIVDKSACWDCAACIKECPVQAIEMYLQPEIGGKGATLTAKQNGSNIIWKIIKDKKIYEEIETDLTDIMP